LCSNQDKEMLNGFACYGQLAYVFILSGFCRS
jgi:hypothetical protein